MEAGAGAAAEATKAAVTAAPVQRVLVVYATKYGSTAKVAETIAEELRAAGCEAEARAVGDAGSTAGFDAVVVGGPMVFGWHKDALKYVKARRDALAAVPVAYFITAASLTDDGSDAIDGVPVYKDSWLAKKPGDPAKLSYRQRYALPSHYLGDVLKDDGAGAAAPGGVLRRRPRPDEDEPLRQALRHARDRRLARRRPPLGRRPRVGARVAGGAVRGDSRPRRSADRTQAPGGR